MEWTGRSWRDDIPGSEGEVQSGAVRDHSFQPFRGSREGERHAKRLIKRSQAYGFEGADVVGQERLRQADERVAMDAGVMLESIFGTDVDLSGQAVTAGVDRRADDGRKQGIDQRLSTGHDEDPRALGISAPGPTHPEKVAPLQISA